MGVPRKEVGYVEHDVRIGSGFVQVTALSVMRKVVVVETSKLLKKEEKTGCFKRKKKGRESH